MCEGVVTISVPQNFTHDDWDASAEMKRLGLSAAMMHSATMTLSVWLSSVHQDRMRLVCEMVERMRDVQMQEQDFISSGVSYSSQFVTDESGGRFKGYVAAQVAQAKNSCPVHTPGI